MLIGVLTAHSATHELYAVVDDLLIWNGFRLIRKKDVVRREDEPHRDFYLDVLRKKSLAAPRLMKAAIKQVDAVSILGLLRKRETYAGFFFEEFRGDEDFFLGKVQDVRDSKFEIAPVDTYGRRYDSNSLLNLASLTRVDFWGEYERSFDLIHNTGTI